LLKKSCRLWDNLKKYSRAGRPQMTICHMQMATYSLSEYVKFILFHCKNECTKASECYIIVHCLSCYEVTTSNNTGQHGFCPMRKNVCFSCIFGCWIQIFPKFLHHPHFSRCISLCENTNLWMWVLGVCRS
jgi:hypothetical protein